MSALEDIRVLACEQFEAGTICTELLAFLGAEVIMVETPGRGQPGRWQVTTKPGADSFYHISLTLNKKSITLDLSKPKGLEIFREMAKKADIVFDNLGPGTMDRLGLGYEELKKVNPRLIVGTVKGFGEGPYGNYLCYDTVAQAMGGACAMTSWPDKPPALSGTTLGDTGAGMHGFVALLAALEYRDVTGEGQFVEVALADSSLCYNRAPLSLRQAERDPMFQGEPAKRLGNTMPGVAPYGLYQTTESQKSDNYIVIHVMDQTQWNAMLRAIGKIELIGDPKFKDSASRWEHREVVDKMIEDWTCTKTAQTAFHALAEAGVPAGITLTTTQVMNDPHFVERKSVVELDHPVRGSFKTVTSPCRLAKSPLQLRCAPLLGEHNEEIYAKLLGYTKEDLATLKEEGVTV